MFTVVRIPYSRAPEDPTWMAKVRTGRKLNPLEANMYYEKLYTDEMNLLQKDTAFDGIPSNA